MFINNIIDPKYFILYLSIYTACDCLRPYNNLISGILNNKN